MQIKNCGPLFFNQIGPFISYYSNTVLKQYQGTTIVISIVWKAIEMIPLPQLNSMESFFHYLSGNAPV